MTATVATPEKRQTILTSLAAGSTVTAACEAADINRATFYRWTDRDDDFAEEVRETQAASVIAVEDAVFLAILDNPQKCQTLAIWWLQNRAPDRWQDRRNLRVSGDPDGVPVQVQVEQDYLDRRIAELLESMERAEGAVPG